MEEQDQLDTQLQDTNIADTNNQQSLITKETDPPGSEYRSGVPEYIQNVYDKLDFSDSNEIKNIADFAIKLNTDYSFASGINELTKTEESNDDFYENIIGSFRNPNQILVDADIDTPFTNDLEKMFAQKKGASFAKENDSRRLFGLRETFVDDYLKYNENQVVQNPDNPNQYALIYKSEDPNKEPTYTIVDDLDNISTMGKAAMVIGGVIPKAAVGLGSELLGVGAGALEYIFTPRAPGGGDFSVFYDNVFFRKGEELKKGLGYNNTEADLTDEEAYKDLSFLEKASQEFSKAFDSTYWIGGAGDSALTSLVEFAAPSAAIAKVAKLGKLGKLTGKLDDVIGNGSKMFQKGGDALEKMMVYGVANTALEAHTEGKEAYKMNFESMQDEIASGEITEDEAKAIATEAAIESTVLNSGALLMSNMLEGGIYMAPILSSPVRFLSTPAKAGVLGAKVAVQSANEGGQELVQYGIQKYVEDKYKDGKVKDYSVSRFKKIKDFIATGLEDDPEAMTSFVSGAILGGGMTTLTNSSEVIEDVAYKFANKDLIKAVHSELMSGQKLFKTVKDDNGKNYVTLDQDAVLSHYKFLNSLDENIEQVNGLAENFSENKDDIKHLLTERMGMFIHNIMQKDPSLLRSDMITENKDGSYSLDPKHPVIKVLSKELSFNKSGYRKAGFDKKISFEDWQEIRDTALGEAAHAYSEFADQNFDVLQGRVPNEETANRLNKAINQEIYNARLGATSAQKLANKYDRPKDSEGKYVEDSDYVDKKKFDKYNKLVDIYTKAAQSQMIIPDAELSKLAKEQEAIATESDASKVNQELTKKQMLISKVKAARTKIANLASKGASKISSMMPTKKKVENTVGEKQSEESKKAEAEVEAAEAARLAQEAVEKKNREEQERQQSSDPTINPSQGQDPPADDSSGGAQLSLFDNLVDPKDDPSRQKFQKSKKEKEALGKFSEEINSLVKDYTAYDEANTDIVNDPDQYFEDVSTRIEKNDAISKTNRDTLLTMVDDAKKKIKDQLREQKKDQDEVSINNFIVRRADNYENDPATSPMSLAYNNIKVQTKSILDGVVSFFTDQDQMYNEDTLPLMSEKYTKVGTEFSISNIGKIDDNTTPIYNIPAYKENKDDKVFNVDTFSAKQKGWVREEMTAATFFEEYADKKTEEIYLKFGDKVVTLTKEDLVPIELTHSVTGHTHYLHVPTWFSYDNMSSEDVVTAIQNNIEFRKQVMQSGVGSKLYVESMSPGVLNLAADRYSDSKGYAGLEEVTDIPLVIKKNQDVILSTNVDHSLAYDGKQNVDFIDVHPGGVGAIVEDNGKMVGLPLKKKVLNKDQQLFIRQMIDFFFTGEAKGAASYVLKEHPDLLDSNDIPIAERFSTFINNYVNTNSNIAKTRFINSNGNIATILKFNDAISEQNPLPRSVHLNGTTFNTNINKRKGFATYTRDAINDQINDEIAKLKVNIVEDLFSKPNSTIKIYSDKGSTPVNYNEYVFDSLESSVLPVKVDQGRYAIRVNKKIILTATPPANKSVEPSTETIIEPEVKVKQQKEKETVVKATEEVKESSKKAPKTPADPVSKEANINTSTDKEVFVSIDDLEFLQKSLIGKTSLTPTDDQIKTEDPPSLDTEVNINNKYIIPNVDTYFLNDLYNSIFGTIAEKLAQQYDKNYTSENSIDSNVVNTILFDYKKQLIDKIFGIIEKAKKYKNEEDRQKYLNSTEFRNIKTILTLVNQEKNYTLFETKLIPNIYRYINVLNQTDNIYDITSVEEYIKATTEGVDTVNTDNYFDLPSELEDEADNNSAYEDINSDQLNEERSIMLNPKNKDSIKQKIFLSSIKTGEKNSLGFDIYYPIDVIKPQLLSLLALNNGNYYELNYKNIDHIISKSNYAWKKELLKNLKGKSQQFIAQFINNNHTIAANFEQVIRDVNNEQGGFNIKILPTDYFNLSKNILNAAFNNLQAIPGISVAKDRVVFSEDNYKAFVLLINDLANTKKVAKKDLSQFLKSLGFSGVDSIIDNKMVLVNNVVLGNKKKTTILEYFQTNKNHIIGNYQTNLDPETRSIAVDNIHNNTFFKVFAKELGLAKGMSENVMNRDGTKMTSNYIIPSFFYKIFLETQHNPELLTNIYSKSSEWITDGHIGNVTYSTLALQAMKSTNAKTQKPALKSLDKSDIEHLSVMSFFGDNTMFNDKLKAARYLTSTYSDKGKGNFIRAFRLKYGKNWVNNTAAKKRLFDHLILPDLNRMGAMLGHTPNLAYYKPFVFYGVPELNNVQEIKNLLKEIQQDPKAIEKFKKSEFVDAMTTVMVSKIQAGINQTRKNWETYSIGYSPERKEFTSIDNKTVIEYRKAYAGSTDKNVNYDLNEDLIRDYYINYVVALQNMQMLYFGDPAQYNTGKVKIGENDISSFIKGINDNISKRLAKMSSPSTPMVYRKSTINYGVIGDNGTKGLNINSIAKLLDGNMDVDKIAKEYEEFNKETDDSVDFLIKEYDKNPSRDNKALDYFPNSASFFEIQHADAQEFVHWLHRLDVLFAEGKIGPTQYNELAAAQITGEPIDETDSKNAVWGAKKPLYVGNKNEALAAGNMPISYYVKSSDIPLLPKNVRGTEMESVLKYMSGDELNKINLNNVSKLEDGRYNLPQPRIERLVFESAIKQGLPKGVTDLFDNNQKLITDNLANIQILSLPSQYLGNQLEVPVKDKNEVTDSIQLRKLLFANIGSESLIIESPQVLSLLREYNGTTDEVFQMRDLKKLRDSKYSELFNLRAKQMIAKVTSVETGKDGKSVKTDSQGNPLVKLDTVKLHDLIHKEMRARNYDINQRNFIKILPAEYGKVFALPLYMTSNPGKFNALIASLINSSVTRGLKRSGFGGVQASSLGTNTTFTDKLPDNDIVYVDPNFNGVLKFLSNNGVAQVILPWRYKTSIDNFLNEDGKTLDLTKVPKELLRGIGFRIPNQGHSSMLPFEIVGFAPSSVGNVVIVPSEIVTQMGSDFDVDKLYSYLPSSKLNLTKTDLVSFKEYTKDIEIDIDSILNSEEEVESQDIVDSLTPTQADRFFEYYKNKLKIIPEGTQESNLTDNIFDIEYEVLSNVKVKRESSKPLDDAVDELTSVIDDIEAEYTPIGQITANKAIPNYNDLNFQRDKFAAGTDSKKGTGAFSLDATFAGSIQEYDIAIRNPIPLTINGVRVGNSLSNVYDQKTLDKLKKIYKDLKLNNKYVIHNYDTNQKELVDYSEIGKPFTTLTEVVRFFETVFDVNTKLVDKDSIPNNESDQSVKDADETFIKDSEFFVNNFGIEAYLGNRELTEDEQNVLDKYISDNQTTEIDSESDPRLTRKNDINKNKPLSSKEIADGVKIIDNALTSSEELEIFEMLKPFIESQGAKSNKGKAAPIMIGLGLRWDYKSNNSGKTPINIKETIVNTSSQRSKYAYYDVSIDGDALGKIPNRLKDLMTKATGIDASNYDGAIINVYTENSFISAHNDVDESVTAVNYPVLVVNIGGKGSLSIENIESQKAKKGYSTKEYLNEPLKSGSAYIFGEDGKNRDVFHRTLPSDGRGTLPELNVKGKRIPSNSYRISVTLRRVNDLKEDMPITPNKLTEFKNKPPKDKRKAFNYNRFTGKLYIDKYAELSNVDINDLYEEYNVENTNDRASIKKLYNSFIINFNNKVLGLDTSRVSQKDLSKLATILDYYRGKKPNTTPKKTAKQLEAEENYNKALEEYQTNIKTLDLLESPEANELFNKVSNKELILADALAQLGIQESEIETILNKNLEETVTEEVKDIEYDNLRSLEKPSISLEELSPEEMAKLDNGEKYIAVQSRLKQEIDDINSLINCIW